MIGIDQQYKESRHNKTFSSASKSNATVEDTKTIQTPSVVGES